MNFNIKNAIFTAFLLVFGSSIASAQVFFQLEKLADGKTYQVSMVSAESYEGVQNLISTAQVSVTAPTGALNPTNIESKIVGVEWEANAITEDAAQNRGTDYISFGLTTPGIRNVKFNQGGEVVLFTFENANACAGDIALMDNATDPLFNSKNKTENHGNQMSVLGARGDAYKGNLGHAAYCDLAGAASKVSPNPTAGAFEVVYEAPTANVTDAVITVSDALGRTISTQNVAVVEGMNYYNATLQNQETGVYRMTLVSAGRVLMRETVVRIER